MRVKWNNPQIIYVYIYIPPFCIMGKIYIFDAKHILNEMISSVLRMQQEHFRLDN